MDLVILVRLLELDSTINIGNEGSDVVILSLRVVENSTIVVTYNYKYYNDNNNTFPEFVRVHDVLH